MRIFGKHEADPENLHIHEAMRAEASLGETEEGNGARLDLCRRIRYNDTHILPGNGALICAISF